jgi:hypothetical protein
MHRSANHLSVDVAGTRRRAPTIKYIASWMLVALVLGATVKKTTTLTGITTVQAFVLPTSTALTRTQAATLELRHPWNVSTDKQCPTIAMFSKRSSRTALPLLKQPKRTVHRTARIGRMATTVSANTFTSAFDISWMGRELNDVTRWDELSRFLCRDHHLRWLDWNSNDDWEYKEVAKVAERDLLQRAAALTIQLEHEIHSIQTEAAIVHSLGEQEMQARAKSLQFEINQLRSRHAALQCATTASATGIATANGNQQAGYSVSVLDPYTAAVERLSQLASQSRFKATPAQPLSTNSATAVVPRVLEPFSEVTVLVVVVCWLFAHYGAFDWNAMQAWISDSFGTLSNVFHLVMSSRDTVDSVTAMSSLLKNQWPEFYQTLSTNVQSHASQVFSTTKETLNHVIEPSQAAMVHWATSIQTIAVGWADETQQGASEAARTLEQDLAQLPTFTAEDWNKIGLAVQSQIAQTWEIAQSSLEERIVEPGQAAWIDWASSAETTLDDWTVKTQIHRAATNEEIQKGVMAAARTLEQQLSQLPNALTVEERNKVGSAMQALTVQAATNAQETLVQRVIDPGHVAMADWVASLEMTFRDWSVKTQAHGLATRGEIQHQVGKAMASLELGVSELCHVDVQANSLDWIRKVLDQVEPMQFALPLPPAPVIQIPPLAWPSSFNMAAILDQVDQIQQSVVGAIADVKEVVPSSTPFLDHLGEWKEATAAPANNRLGSILDIDGFIDLL